MDTLNTMEILEKTAHSLNRFDFKAKVFPRHEEAVEAIMELIGKRSVGIGGSLTVEKLGLYERLKENGNEVYWTWRDTPPDKKVEVMRKGGTADLYLTSSNAVTEDGRLVNVDGRGNRVGAMIFGPRTVIVVCGRNKIVPDLTAAMARMKTFVCPENTRRLKRNTPCVKTGVCQDCLPPERACRVTTILEGPMKMMQDEVHVILIDEDYGI